ncbi:glycosyl hydrolase family 8 [Arthrobacter sp. H41]|uniref:glycosyl hydrolase family 8 n=1 Tax=Arthrobacter sp. H41 TaxID=1312978 RepID=UPI000676A91B|nr:glycosyl hydrolase family 8 [Arthrobacter sp. H41]
MKKSTLLAVVAFGVVTLLVVVAAALWSTGVLRPSNNQTQESSGGSGPAVELSIEQVTPEESARSFLETWVDDDGRVVRRDQGNDTVSEGQAYGLMIALGAEDEERFEAIWSWTEQNLMRDDGLLAWRWRDGAVVDAEPASDADVDAARALVLAGERFDRADFTAAGQELAAQVLDLMTAQTSLGRILLPGLWAAGGPDYFYNPSYASPVSFTVLFESSGDPRWNELVDGGRAVTGALLDKSPLPPDWAQVTADGQVNAMPGAGGQGDDVRYSYDAARLPIRFAESCQEADRNLAARMFPALNRTPELPAVLDLGGAPLNEDQHPVGYLGRAAAAASAGQLDDAREDVRKAEKVAAQFSTYYGAGWVSTGRLMLETDVLGGCPVLAPQKIEVQDQ